MRKPWKDQKCVVLRGGLRLWVDSDLAKAMARAKKGTSTGNLEVDPSKVDFVVEGSWFTADQVVMILDGKAISDDENRKKGMVECPSTGAWHVNQDECDCYERLILPTLLESGIDPLDPSTYPEEYGRMTPAEIYHMIMANREGELCLPTASLPTT